MKKCCKCKIEKDLNLFNKNKNLKFGRHGTCIECRKIYNTKNKEKIAKSCADYYKINQDKLKECRKEYRLINISKIKDYKSSHKKERNIQLRQRYLDDINYKLATNLRCRLYSILKSNAKIGSAVKNLGCSIEFLKQYLESKFQEGMSWENYGNWHIDHILPLSKFDLTNREQFLKVCNYTNLQPLWAIDNIKKGNKIYGI